MASTTRDVFREFDTLTGFVERAELVPYHSTMAGTGWVGGVGTFDQAVGLARSGWSDVRPEVDAMVDCVVSQVRDAVTEVPTYCYDQVGGYLDLDAVFAGDPDFMVRYDTVTQPASDQVVRLLVDTGANGITSGDRMLKRAAAIAALVDLLVLSSRQVDLFITSPVKYSARSQREHNMVVHLHHAGDHLDVDGLMFALGHPAFHRFLWFSHRRQDGVGSSMGNSVDVSDQLSSRVGADLVVRRDMHRRTGCPASFDDQQGWVRWHLKELGVIV